MNVDEEIRSLNDDALPLSTRIAIAAKLTDLQARIGYALLPLKARLRLDAEASPESSKTFEGEGLSAATAVKQKAKLAFVKGAKIEFLREKLGKARFEAILKKVETYEFRPQAKMMISKLPAELQNEVFSQIVEKERVTRISFVYGGSGLTMIGEDDPDV